jgi:hypothetical protein
MKTRLLFFALTRRLFRLVGCGASRFLSWSDGS